MTGLPIASHPDTLDTAWLTAALRSGGALEAGAVTHVERAPIGTGQMCDSLRLTLDYDGDEGPPTVVAKLPAADPTSRQTARALRTYEIEVRFYQQLAADLPVRNPTCLYADIDVATADFVLLLEDMAPAEQGEQMAGCTPDQAEVAVQELVKLHAPRWGDPSLEQIGWIGGGLSGASGLLADLHAGFRERYADRLDADAVAACDLLFAHLDRHLAPRRGPRTLVHGDYRLDNLLFGALDGEVPVAVVDWQTLALGTGTSDVAYFLGAGLHTDARRTHEAELVAGYHRALVAAGVKGYPWSQCWEDYRRATWSGLIMAVAASMLVERTERGDEMFLTMAHRHARHALDLEAAALWTS